MWLSKAHSFVTSNGRLRTRPDDAQSVSIRCEIELVDVIPDLDQSRGSIQNDVSSIKLAPCDIGNARSSEEALLVMIITTTV